MMYIIKCIFILESYSDSKIILKNFWTLYNIRGQTAWVCLYIRVSYLILTYNNAHDDTYSHCQSLAAINVVHEPLVILSFKILEKIYIYRIFAYSSCTHTLLILSNYYKGKPITKYIRQINYIACRKLYEEVENRIDTKFIDIKNKISIID